MTKPDTIHSAATPQMKTLKASGKSSPPLEVPVYPEPFALGLILNTEAFPIIEEDAEARSLTVQMMVDYVARINGYRSLAEQRAAAELDREQALLRQHKADRKFHGDKAKEFLRLSNLPGEKGKRAHTSIERVKAALEVELTTNKALIKADEAVWTAKADVRGYTAKIEALRLHMSAHREEITADRDMIAHLVNSGLVAVAGLPPEEEDIGEEGPVG